MIGVKYVIVFTHINEKLIFFLCFLLLSLLIFACWGQIAYFFGSGLILKNVLVVTYIDEQLLFPNFLSLMTFIFV